MQMASAKKKKSNKRARPKEQKGIFGKKVFTMEEEHSMLLFVAGIVFGIGLVSMTIDEYYYLGLSLFTLLLVLLFIDKRLKSR